MARRTQIQNAESCVGLSHTNNRCQETIRILRHKALDVISRHFQHRNHKHRLYPLFAKETGFHVRVSLSASKMLTNSNARDSGTTGRTVIVRTRKGLSHSTRVARSSPPVKGVGHLFNEHR